MEARFHSPIAAPLKKIDKNNDGKLSPDEIAERLAYFQQSGMQLNVVADIYLDGRPLGGATVTLVPEKFMGPATKPATATTDEEGMGQFRIEGSGDPIAPGYYRVKVSKNVGGRETVPAKFNEQTTLGQEIVPEGAGRGSMLTVRLPALLARVKVPPARVKIAIAGIEIARGLDIAPTVHGDSLPCPAMPGGRPGAAVGRGRADT